MQIINKQCLYLLSVRTQGLKQNTFDCHLLQLSTVLGNHQVDYTATYIENNADMDARLLKHCINIRLCNRHDPHH
jgi:hypothetical protein